MGFIENLEKELFEMQDLKYRDFHSRLLPGIDKETIIGIRTPMLRKFTKEYAKTPEADLFMQELPHRYYEENNMHMMIASWIKDYEKCLAQVKRFLPYVNNWATCDLPAPKAFAKHKDKLLPEILMTFYLDEDFRPEYLNMAADVESEEYYVNMMIAWYFATALAKQWDATIPYLKERKLPEWVHRKTIQKAIESYRITPEQKVYLKTLRK